jgi:hypothetical protein
MTQIILHIIDVFLGLNVTVVIPKLVPLMII